MSLSKRNHNALGGLQGGSAGEYYHSTSAQISSLDRIPTSPGVGEVGYYWKATGAGTAAWGAVVVHDAVTLGANTNGLQLSGQVLQLDAATGSVPGAVTTAAQTFSGVKTFNNSPDITAVYGDITQGGITKGGQRWIHSGNSSGNVFIGLNSGNFTYTGDFNTGIGQNSLQALTTGYQNTGIGHRALEAATEAHDCFALGYISGVKVTTGSHNVLIGSSSGPLLTTGERNTFIGSYSGAQTTGSRNIAVGNEAFYGITAGTDNIAVGYRSMGQTTGGNHNIAIATDSLYTHSGSYTIAIGNEALKSSLTTSDCIAIGYKAGYSNTGSHSNIAIGTEALYSSNVFLNIGIGVRCLRTATGAANVGVGYEAGRYVTSGEENVCMGYYALRSVSAGTSTGSFNVAFGSKAMQQANSASFCVAIGRESLQKVTGSSNVAIGERTGYNNTSGASNTLLGYYAGYTQVAVSNNVFLGYMAGRYETVGSKLIIDALDRTNEANQRVQALIYGEFNSTLTSQFARVNGYFSSGVGGVSPTAPIHVDSGNGVASAIKLTAGTTTGVTASDGFELGIDTSGNGELRQRENLDIILFANNAEKWRALAAGDWKGVGNRLTPEGGYAVKLTAGEDLYRGEIVWPGTSDMTVVKTPANGDMQSGVVYADATNGNEVWIVVAGIAYVKPKDTITLTRQYVIYVSDTAGRVDQSASISVLPDHWKECGHVLESGSGAGALARCFIHFN